MHNSASGVVVVRYMVLAMEVRMCGLVQCQCVAVMCVCGMCGFGDFVCERLGCSV